MITLKEENMRIAILSCCDFSVVGGAERFIINIARALDATIISIGSQDKIAVDYNLNNVKFEFLNKTLPSEPLRQIVGSRLFSKLSLNYDFYISTDDMSMHFLKNNPNHLYYIFTPRRAFYDMYYDVMSTKTGFKSLIYPIGLWWFRNQDRRFVKNHIKNISCISNNVRNRVQKAYLRNASVIYPCIDCSKYHYERHEDYWLSVNRIDKWKRVDLQVEAFRKMPYKTLLIVGTVYPEMQWIVDGAPSNVIFKGTVTELELRELYSKCTGFITTAIDEDFGITPLEAMASGKPVVATKEGGYLETIINGHTGILVTPNVDEIINAVSKISSEPGEYVASCLMQAADFSYEIFKNNIQKEISCIK